MEVLRVSKGPLTWRTSVGVEGGARRVVVAIAGELDRMSLPELERHLTQLAAGDPSTVVLDLCDVTFADVGAYRFFDAFGHALAYAGGALRLRHVPLAVRRLLDVVGLPASVSVDDSEWPGAA